MSRRFSRAVFASVISSSGGGSLTYSLSGDIVDGADAGIEGVLVTLSGDADDTDTTDSNGHYEFTGLVDGSYTVTPTKDDHVFVPTSRAVEVSGDDAVADDMVGTEFLTLPYSYDISTDITETSGLVSAVSDWAVWSGVPTSGVITTSNLADINSHTPSGVTKAVQVKWDATRRSAIHMLPKGIAPLLPSLRFSWLARDVGAANRLGGGGALLDASWRDGVSTRENTLRAFFSGNANPDAVNSQSWYNSETLSNEMAYQTTGLNNEGRRWSWYRAEWNFVTNKITVAMVRAQDSVQLFSIEANIDAAGQSLGSVPAGMVDVGFWADEGTSDTYIAKFWIGTASDAWPT